MCKFKSPFSDRDGFVRNRNEKYHLLRIKSAFSLSGSSTHTYGERMATWGKGKIA